MTNLKKLLGVAGIAAVMCLGVTQTSAQQEQRRERGERGGGRGNFDPEQMQQRMNDALKEKMEVKDDAEWKLIYARIQKVQEAQRYVPSNRMNAGALFRPGGGDGGGDRGGRGGRGGFGGFGNAALPEAEALDKAIESKASADEIKAKLAKLRDARKQKQADLDKAQNELREVLSGRQEAIAVTLGLLH